MLNAIVCPNTDCPKPSDSSSRAALLEQDQSQQQRQQQQQQQQHHVPHHLNKQPQSFQTPMPNNHCPTRQVALLPGIQSAGAIPVQYGTLRHPRTRTGTELQQMAANATLDRSLLQRQHSDVCLMG